MWVILAPEAPEPDLASQKAAVVNTNTLDFSPQWKWTVTFPFGVFFLTCRRLLIRNPCEIMQKSSIKQISQTNGFPFVMMKTSEITGMNKIKSKLPCVLSAAHNLRVSYMSECILFPCSWGLRYDCVDTSLFFCIETVMWQKPRSSAAHHFWMPTVAIITQDGRAGGPWQRLPLDSGTKSSRRTEANFSSYNLFLGFAFGFLELFLVLPAVWDSLKTLAIKYINWK